MPGKRVMNPQTVLKINELLDEIDTLYRDPTSINDIRLAQLKKQVDSLPDLVSRHHLQGAIAGLKCDVDRVHSHFQSALNLSSGNVHKQLIPNYAIALRNMGYVFKASELLLEHYQSWFDDLVVLSKTIDFCILAGRIFQGEMLLQHWHKLKRKLYYQESVIRDWAQFYRQNELTEAEIASYLEAALSLLRQTLRQRRRRFKLGLDYFNDEGDPFLSYTICLDLPIGELLALDDQHSDLLVAGHFKSELLHGIIITFEPFEEKKDG